MFANLTDNFSNHHLHLASVNVFREGPKIGNRLNGNFISVPVHHVPRLSALVLNSRLWILYDFLNMRYECESTFLFILRSWNTSLTNKVVESCTRERHKCIAERLAGHTTDLGVY